MINENTLIEDIEDLDFDKNRWMNWISCFIAHA